MEKYFEPFVQAMIISLGNETAYLVIDCTQAGRKCRTLFIGLAYHGTVLPVVWKTLKGKKGHVKGQFQKELLTQIHRQFQHCRRVIVLGDAKFSNEPVINSLRPKKGGFVFRFQSNYRIQLEPQPTDERRWNAGRPAAFDNEQRTHQLHQASLLWYTIIVFVVE